jgi:hypothetical protein
MSEDYPTPPPEQSPAAQAVLDATGADQAHPWSWLLAGLPPPCVLLRTKWCLGSQSQRKTL